MDTLGEKLKFYELQTDYALSPDAYWVMRLDGNRFSKLTKKINAQKPYDEEFAEAIRKTTIDLMQKFGFVTGYCQSDEITLVPNLVEGNRNDLWGLRIQKLCSIVASYASVRFNNYLAERLGDIDAVFDARVILLENLEEVRAAILWRQNDCLKNAKNLCAQYYFTPKELHGLTSDEQIALMLREKSVDFETFPASFRYGSLFKRKQIPMQGINPTNGEVSDVLRSVIYETNEYAPRTEFVLSKYWNEY